MPRITNVEEIVGITENITENFFDDGLFLRQEEQCFGNSNTFCATIFIVGLVKYCRKQPIPWVALAVAIPYMVCAVAMGYTRQSAAIGFFLCGLSILRPGNELKYLVLILLGSIFHLSVIVTLPLIIFAREKVHWLAFPLIGIFLYDHLMLINL